MRNITRFALVITPALLLAACTSQAPNPAQSQPTATPTEASTSFSLRDLVGMGKDQTCTFDVTSSDGSSVTTSTSGTVYVSGSNLAENLQIVSSDKNEAVQNLNIISDGTYIYTYGNAEKLPGMKFKITALPTGTTSATTTQTQGTDMNKKINMKCSPWTVDAAKFTLPTNIKFTDLTAFMQKVQAAVTPSATPTVSSGDE
jgi:hypothetical protein